MPHHARHKWWDPRNAVHEPPEALDEQTEDDGEQTRVDLAALQPPRRAAPEHLPHQQPEIERPGVNEHALENVLVTAQVGPAHSARVVDVGERALDVLATPPHQPTAPLAADASAIAVHRGLRRGRLRPAPPPALRLRDVAAAAPPLPIGH